MYCWSHHSFGDLENCERVRSQIPDHAAWIKESVRYLDHLRETGIEFDMVWPAISNAGWPKIDETPYLLQTLDMALDVPFLTSVEIRKLHGNKIRLGDRLDLWARWDKGEGWRAIRSGKGEVEKHGVAVQSHSSSALRASDEI